MTRRHTYTPSHPPPPPPGPLSDDALYLDNLHDDLTNLVSDLWTKNSRNPEFRKSIEGLLNSINGSKAAKSRLEGPLEIALLGDGHSFRAGGTKETDENGISKIMSVPRPHTESRQPWNFDGQTGMYIEPGEYQELQEGRAIGIVPTVLPIDAIGQLGSTSGMGKLHRNAHNDGLIESSTVRPFTENGMSWWVNEDGLWRPPASYHSDPTAPPPPPPNLAFALSNASKPPSGRTMVMPDGSVATVHDGGNPKPVRWTKHTSWDGKVTYQTNHPPEDIEDLFAESQLYTAKPQTFLMKFHRPVTDDGRPFEALEPEGFDCYGTWVHPDEIDEARTQQKRGRRSSSTSTGPTNAARLRAQQTRARASANPPPPPEGSAYMFSAPPSSMEAPPPPPPPPGSEPMFSNPPPPASSFSQAPPPQASNFSRAAPSVSAFSPVSMPPRGPAPTTHGTGFGGSSDRSDQFRESFNKFVRSYVESDGVVRPPPRSSDCATRMPSYCHDITNVPSLGSSFRPMGKV